MEVRFELVVFEEWVRFHRMEIVNIFHGSMKALLVLIYVFLT